MKGYFHFQERRTQYILFIIFVILGLLLATQIKVQPSSKQKLEAETSEDLGEIINNLNTESNKMRNEIADLRITLSESKLATYNQNEILNEAARSLNNLKIFNGMLPVKGKGIYIEVIDKNEILTSYDINELVQELKNGGAEIISVNENRVVVHTYFIDRDESIIMDGNDIRPPYRIKAIGNQNVLISAIKLPGGIIDALKSLSGVNIDIQKDNLIEIEPSKNKIKVKESTPIFKE